MNSVDVFDKTRCRLLACNGAADHLQMLVEYPPKYSIPVLVNAFKETSSRRLRKERSDIASRHRDGVLWSPAYFAASTGGATLDVVKQYVELQRQRAPPRPEGRGFRALKNR